MNTIDRNNDIIVALATPYGKSAVAVIRISGKNCFETVDRFLSRPVEVEKMRVCRFSCGEFTEKLMATAFKGPKSYTGEDVVELFPHGNTVICDTIIKVLTENGARNAERGEFTKRAFLNGKVDLMQCEALADIIDAQTSEQLVYGNKRYDGGFKELGEAEKIIGKVLSDIEAVLHYGDEMESGEIDEAAESEIEREVDAAIEKLQKEVRGFAGGKIVNDGFKIALIGAPNVGKSTLLNALIGNDRAIVTPIAGTTRDTVDGDYVYNGRKFTVTDTAGITETTDEVEKIGVLRAKEASKTADAVVIVSSAGEENKKVQVSAPVCVYVENKCDSEADVGTAHKSAQKDEMLRISAKNGINITALKQLLYELCPKDYGAVCNHRQYECAVACLDSLEAAKKEIKKVGGTEIVAALLYEAYSAITRLRGEQADENVISLVFERFCVGK